MNIELVLSIVVPIFVGLAWFYSKIDRRFDLIDKRFDKIENRIDKLDEKLTDIDRRLCRLEGAFSAKECCVIKSDNQARKAE